MTIFSEFFKEWLYGESGYYSNIESIGKEGDFYTSVSASRFFGGSIANHIKKEIDAKRLDRESTIIEIGADRGYLMADIIQFLYTLERELVYSLKFTVVEPLPYLEKIQKSYFYKSFGDEIKINHVKEIEEIEEKSVFAYANELFDAFPCELLHEEKLAFVEDFKIEFAKCENEAFEVAKKYNIKRGEIPLGFYKFAKELFECGDSVEFIAFDYGKELHRGDFNIRIYKDHKVLPLFDKEANLKELYGKSDITYDLFFGFLVDEFKRAGFLTEKIKNQNSALIDFGLLELLDILQKNSSQNIYLRELNKVKTLIDPMFMGDRFKMCRFVKR